MKCDFDPDCFGKNIKYVLKINFVAIVFIAGTYFGISIKQNSMCYKYFNVSKSEYTEMEFAKNHPARYRVFIPKLKSN